MPRTAIYTKRARKVLEYHKNLCLDGIESANITPNPLYKGPQFEPTALADLLADLMHWAEDEAEFSFDEALSLAQRYHTEERTDG